MARSDAGARGHPSRLALSAFTRVCDALWLAPQDEVRNCCAHDAENISLVTPRPRGHPVRATEFLVPPQSALLNVMPPGARKAARSLKRDFGELEKLQVSMKGPANFVTAADKRAEEILYAELTKSRPGYGFLGEERSEERRVGKECR